VKIVLDTTILVRANEHSQGLARDLLLTIIDSEHRLILSNEILNELARVLRYPRLQTFYDLPETLVCDYIAFLHRSSEIVALNPLVMGANPRRERRYRDADRDHWRSGRSLYEG